MEAENTNKIEYSINRNKLYIIKEETKEELEEFEKEPFDLEKEPVDLELVDIPKLKISSYMSDNDTPYFAYYKGDKVISSMFG